MSKNGNYIDPTSVVITNNYRAKLNYQDQLIFVTIGNSNLNLQYEIIYTKLTDLFI